MTSTVQTYLRELLGANNDFAGRRFSELQTEKLAAYYQLVLKWNGLLHLTTLTTPEEFWQRHIYEAVLISDRLSPEIEAVWDLGSGLGVPGLPLAVMRPDLRVHLIEAQSKKAIFLEEAVAVLRILNVTIENVRLETKLTLPACTALVARAVDKMSEILPQILSLGEQASQILLLGSYALAAQVERLSSNKTQVQSFPLPNSHNNLLIEIRRFT